MSQSKKFDEVSDFKVMRMDKDTVFLSWSRPSNCHSVDITRSTPEGELFAYKDLKDNMYIAGLTEGVTYDFVIVARYIKFNKSQGITHKYKHEHEITPFPIKVEHIQSYTYKVFWKMPSPDIKMHILVDKKIIKELTSGTGVAEIVLPANGTHTISAQAYSLRQWICSSNTETINTYLPIKINKTNTTSQITERTYSGGNRLNISISLQENIHDGILGFYYTVKIDPNNKWLTTQEINNINDTYTGIRYINMEKYTQDPYLPYDLTLHTEDTLYITVVTVYKNKSGEYVFEHSHAQILRPLVADVFWSVKKRWLRPAQLNIEIISNLLMHTSPNIILCACDTPSRLLSHTDLNSEILLNIPPKKTREPVRIFKDSIKVPVKVSKKKTLFLFVVDNDNLPRKVTFVTKPFNGCNGRL